MTNEELIENAAKEVAIEATHEINGRLHSLVEIDRATDKRLAAVRALKIDREQRMAEAQASYINARNEWQTADREEQAIINQRMVW